MNFLVNKHLVAILVWGGLVSLGSALHGQVAGGPVAPPVAPPPTTAPPATNQGMQTANVQVGDGQIEPPDNVDIQFTEDQRNQGFIGATAQTIQNQGFVGAVSENSGPPLNGDGNFGGGINNSITSGFNGANQGQGQAGQNINQDGVNVFRRSVRARLRPTFLAPRRSPQQVMSRFTSRMTRQPGPQNLGRYNISIQNQTATLTGSVNSPEAANRLVRQLRLEPGVYRIVNQLQIAQ